jgi:hypothetical protein
MHNPRWYSGHLTRFIVVKDQRSNNLNSTSENDWGEHERLSKAAQILCKEISLFFTAHMYERS